jgi:hypothetical protein
VGGSVGVSEETQGLAVEIVAYHAGAPEWSGAGGAALARVLLAALDRPQPLLENTAAEALLKLSNRQGVWRCAIEPSTHYTALYYFVLTPLQSELDCSCWLDALLHVFTHTHPLQPIATPSAIHG